jgi:hypothetical protein
MAIRRSTDTLTGWMPGALRHSTPNFSTGRAGQHVKAVCLHVTSGKRGSEYPNAISWLCNPDSKASAHFIISQTGDISQLVSIIDTAWGNGLSWSSERGSWIDPEGAAVTPSWSGLVIPVNPNYQTISIEHAAQPSDVWSQAMFDANTRILQWIRQQIGLTYVPHASLIGHYELSPVNRPNCPGPNVTYQKVADAGNTVAKLRTFRVNTAGTALIRQGPAVAYPIAGTLHQGDTIRVDTLVTGQAIDGNTQWAHLSKTDARGELGFVTMTVLTEVKQYKVIATEARIRGHLMPLKQGDRSPYRGKLLQGAIVEGSPFGEWLHIQHEKGSGFIRKELALEVVEESDGSNSE